jgi:hypothetical protein
MIFINFFMPLRHRGMRRAQRKIRKNLLCDLSFLCVSVVKISGTNPNGLRLTPMPHGGQA